MSGLSGDLIPSTLKRKAFHSDAFQVAKKPRWSLSSGRADHSSNVASAGQCTSSTWKKTAVDVHNSSEKLLATNDIRSPFLPKANQHVSQRTMKEKVLFSASSGSSSLSETAGCPSNKQRRHSSFAASTQQDPIAILSDSDPEDNKSNASRNKTRPVENESLQADVIDLTFEDDEVEVIEMKRLSPNYLQRARIRRFPIPSRRSGILERLRTLDTSSDNESLASSSPPAENVTQPTTLPTPPKSENDEPQSPKPVRANRQQSMSSAIVHSVDKNQCPQDKKSSASASRPLLPPVADIIDLCTDDSDDDLPTEKSDEKKTESLITDGPKETCYDTSNVSDANPTFQSSRQSAPFSSQPVQSNNDDPVRGLIAPVAEMRIDPRGNTPEEEEVLKDVMPEDIPPVKHEGLHPTDFSVVAFGSSSEITSDFEEGSGIQLAQKSEHDIAPCDHNEKLITQHPALVKEPDFSKISTEATEPVPEYDDRLAAAIKWPAEKLPTELHDMINRLPPNYLYSPHMKCIFETMIEENTAEDEPRAPKVQIIGRKNGPVTPPWEFYYTNRIVYGEGVPRSDKKLLQGCDCVGPCDPKSKTCACVQRQIAWTGGDSKGFLYKKEKLLYPYYPVFECNDACECSEECMNRVVQHGRKHHISIALTKNKGWGIFAEEKIPRGTYLGIYSGEMILEAEANERGKLYDRFGRTYLFDVDFYHLRSLDEQGRDDKDKDEEHVNTYTIDAFHVGNFTRFLNHSCDPNCQITATYVNEPDLRKPSLTIFTSRDVQKGEELTFAYFGEPEDEPEDDQASEKELDGHNINMGAGPSTHKQAVHRRCLCGAINCRGQMF